MTDLDAIRARDAALIEENGYLFPPGDDYDSEPWRDRRALLAEVDRLTEGVRWLTADAAAWRKAAEEIGNADIAWEGGAAAERARIRAAASGLLREGHIPDWPGENDYQRGYRDGRNQTVHAVLAAIDGEPT